MLEYMAVLAVIGVVGATFRAYDEENQSHP